MKKLIIAILTVGALGLSQAFAIPQVTMNTFISGVNGNYSAAPNAELGYLLDNYAANANDGTSFGTSALRRTNTSDLETPTTSPSMMAP